MSFLKAEWRKLVLINYEVDPSFLNPYVPSGTTLDRWQGRCYLSLVGFMFINTKLLGIKIPFHTHFEEVNLRFYVKRDMGTETRRGVVFIKEIVPKPALTFVANTIYKENYETMRMSHYWAKKDGHHIISYGWMKNGVANTFSVKAKDMPMDLEVGSEAEFITEHYWGYAQINDITTNEYQVTHPRWQVYPVLDHSIEVDFSAAYGQSFDFLNKLQPKSTMLAEGSLITVEKGMKIRVTK